VTLMVGHLVNKTIITCTILCKHLPAAATGVDGTSDAKKNKKTQTILYHQKQTLHNTSFNYFTPL